MTLVVDKDFFGYLSRRGGGQDKHINFANPDVVIAVPRARPHCAEPAPSPRRPPTFIFPTLRSIDKNYGVHIN